MNPLVWVGLLDMAVILFALFGAGLKIVPFLYWDKPRMTAFAEKLFHASTASGGLLWYRPTTTIYQRQIDAAGLARAVLTTFRHPRVGDLGDPEAYATSWWLFVAVMAAVPLLIAGALSLVWLSVH
ncbi:hypothetical protein [Pararhodobacter aggregans]|uniref:Uncharacterized protein n=1 Tax=Pararhodobacter aggregans TaxID=404875 RepID=A0A2T7UJP8_9RHOB|nr:hypothetical protein [Pararhodobacter aggregans]PTW97547.1 hypothetical protein C8N33_12227 [Pararhodobacter aggregans]PVE44893.1 hypothetical protein DDE23_24155 [Pararhodobacter aggregans]